MVITGASDGIGKSLSKEFARKGFNLILVSRSLEKLSKVKEELLAIYPSRSIEIISADFSYSHRNAANFYNELMEKMSNFNVSILVNNVGVASVKMLNNDTYENLESMLGVNVYPMTMLTHKFIPKFLSRFNETGQKSLIINISSTMEESIFPANATYAATKRYGAFFSEGLRYEYSGKIDFATVKPGVTVTQQVIQNNTQGLPLSTDPDSFAKALLGGLRTGVNHGHWKHKIFGFFLNLSPYLFTITLVRLALPTAIKKGLVS